MNFHTEADMIADKMAKLWLLATFLLICVVIIASLIIWTRRDKGQNIIISSPAIEKFQGNIYIGGAVNNPGLYPLKNTDNLASLILASGGADFDADMSGVRLYVPSLQKTNQPQKIDINRAEAWLLEALPDIGQTKAQAIINHRQQNGPFHSIEEITQVQGISNSTFEKLKELITVSE